MRQRLLFSRVFALLCRLATYSALAVLVILLSSVFVNCVGRLDFDFIRSVNSVSPEKAGMLAGLWGSFWLISLTGLMAIPIGVGSAVYLEEYSSDNFINRVIKVNLSNLAGVPSIVYGMLGLTVFVRMFDAYGGPGQNAKIISLLNGLIRIPIPLGDKVLAGALTMTLVILPIVIIASQEALRAVPSSIRVASLALGATRWQTIRHQVLPAALPGIATGVILAISRAIGETAPLIMIGALTVSRFCPAGIDSPVKLITQPHRILQAPLDQFTAMPIEIFHWAKQPGDDFRPVAAAGIVVLLMVLLLFNGVAVWIRHRAGKKIKW
ncbi:MAG: phosphate ABC transporter permease PstA [Planctomycetaceae bacterium]|nr:phosphate ABC transporter permease PstA [Planctomycetaceae bacterium]